MSAFAGVVTLAATSDDDDMLMAAYHAVSALKAGRSSIRRLAGATFVHCASPGEPRIHGEAAGPLTEVDGRILFAAAARIDNRDELGSVLGLSNADRNRVPDAQLLLALYRRWGDAGIARCVGAFAFALWDAEARRLILGRDCLGNRALFYYRGPRFVAFASSLRLLLALPGVPRAIDEEAVADLLAVNHRDQEHTLYRNILRVPGRTLLTLDASEIQSRKYWSPDLQADLTYRREEEYVERGRELFDLAVACATRDTPGVAIAVSGGLDSSAIAATVARLNRARSITCFCKVPPRGADIELGPFRYLDGRNKVEALARMHPGLSVRFIDSEADDRIKPDDARYFARAGLPAMSGAPPTNSYFAEALRSSGHPAVLIGNHGDFGLSWRGPLSLLALLGARQWRSFSRETIAIARESRRSLPRTIASEIVMPAAPFWLRRLIHRLRGRDPDSVAQHSLLNPVFVADSGLADRWREQRFDPWFGPRDLNPARWRAERIFDHNQYAGDLRAMAPEIVGYEVRDPYADRRVLEFALSVPEPMYRRNGIPRDFARRVFADRLPPIILNERRRGTNTPTWFRSLDLQRQDIAAEIERLDASPLARQLLDLPRLKRLVNDWPKNANEAESRSAEYKLALRRGVHVGRFIRWVEGGNA